MIIFTSICVHATYLLSLILTGWCHLLAMKNVIPALIAVMPVISCFRMYTFHNIITTFLTLKFIYIDGIP